MDGGDGEGFDLIFQERGRVMESAKAAHEMRHTVQRSHRKKGSNNII